MKSTLEALRAASDAHDAGRLGEAESICLNLLPTAPENSEVFFLLGMISHKNGRHEESVKWLRRSAELQPPSVRIFSALGGAYNAAGDLSHAAEFFARCLQLDPRCAPAYYQLGNVCYKMRDRERAAWLFRKSAEFDPRNHKVWNNLANSLRDLGRLEESIAAFDRALEIRPDCPETRVNRSIALLTAGQLELGFREYEWRWQTLEPRKYPQPVWKGEPIAGKTLFVFAEQGLGDTIQFIRYLPQARERAARVVLECQTPLKSLLEASGCADIIIACGEPPPAFDYYVPLLDLPGIFHTTLETIPATIPYLFAPPGGSLPATPAGNLKVGLVWAGNPELRDDAARSIQLEALAPLLQTPNVSFFSLQLGIPARDESFFRSLVNMANMAGQLRTFQDTAGVINGLDLVVSVDTAVAHLAGALGKPVWTFIPASSDWRWLLDRTDTPWYPTMRLFRQPQTGDWQPAILRLAQALRCLVGSLGRSSGGQG